MKRWQMIASAVVVCGLVAWSVFTIANGRNAATPIGAQNKPVATESLTISGTLYLPDFTIEAQCQHASSLIIGTVVKEYPLVISEGGGWVDERTERLRVPYKGYQIEVERWFGGGSLARTIDVYHAGGGQTIIDGKVTSVSVDLTPTLRAGQRVFVPVTRDSCYGVPLGPDSYWAVSDGRGVFVLSDDGSAARAVQFEGAGPKSAGIVNLTSLTQLIGTVQRLGIAERQF